MANKKTGTKARTAASRSATAGKSTRTLTSADRAVLAGAEAPTDKPMHSVMQVLHEARELLSIMTKLGPALQSRSLLKPGVAAELGARKRRLEASEAEWLAHRALRTPKAIDKLRKAAAEVRSDAFAALRYYAADDDEVQARLDLIGEGGGDADLVDDLGKLADLVDVHAATLKKAELPRKPAEALRKLAAELGDAVADRAVDPEGAELLRLRNRAFWMLLDTMDDVRAAGRYVFRRDPKVVSLFRASGTRRRLGKRPRAAPEEGGQGA